MKSEEIRKVFEEHGEPVCMYRDDPTSIVSGLYECKILEMNVTLKDETVITIFCGEKTVIDATNSSEGRYVGLGETLISPMSNIKSIECEWRGRGMERIITRGGIFE